MNSSPIVVDKNRDPIRKLTLCILSGHSVQYCNSQYHKMVKMLTSGSSRKTREETIQRISLIEKAILP